MMILIAMVAGPPIAMFRYGHVNFDRQIVGAAGFLLLAGVFLIALGFVRLAFVFPAIAIGRYAGISAAWKQTAGNLERLAAIILLSYAPYLVVRKILEQIIGYHPPGIKSGGRACVEMFLIALATAAHAAPAPAYRLTGL